MKKLKIIAISILSAVAVFAFSACGGDVTPEPQKFTVSFDTMGGSPVSSYTVAVGEKVTRPKTVPTKEMFTFDDWYWENPEKSGVKQKFVFDTVISQDITLIAGWRGENSVKVEFKPNGGAFADDKEVVLYGLVGSQMTAPTDEPTRNGYVFGGWYEEEECYNEFSFGTYPISNATLYARWNKSSDYSYISFYGNGELIDTIPVKKTDDVVIPDFFGQDNSIVVGNWYTDEAFKTAYTVGKATNDISLYTTYYTDGLTFSVTPNSALVTGYNGTATDIVIPSAYNGKTVSTIGNDAFYRTGELPAITSVKLPGSVTTIGSGAFYNCQYLTSINITGKVMLIGANAFYRNIRLRNVGDLSGVTEIKEGTFSGCQDLRSISLSNMVTKIGDYAFNDCERLTEIAIPASVMDIGKYAFSGCSSIKSVVIGSKIISSIGDCAFADCVNLTEITIEKTSEAVSFGGNPIMNCRNIKIYVPSALLDAYKNSTDNAQFKDSFTAIG